MLIDKLFSEPVDFFAIFIALVVSITFHEFFHVLVARLLGDQTGERMGRLSLSPLAHLDLLGTLAVLFIGFGWGKPAPYNPYNLKNQKYGPLLVALGGPTSNLILIILFGVALKIFYPFFGPENYLIKFLVYLVVYNTILMVFNLLPIPPLEGSSLIKIILGSKYPQIGNFLDSYGPRFLFALILISIILPFSLFDYIFRPFLTLVFRILNIS
ncbi:site-2 protease family protein [Candidatus Falkowbacteria bacterium]|nr:site-2 protease family protein [Candidatus Falkowbacteria bacterium]